MTFNLITVGTVSGALITADLDPAGFAALPVAVTLSANYTMAFPPGYPTRPSLAGVAPVANRSAVLASGTTFLFHRPEAAAIVGAGFGTYA